MDARLPAAVEATGLLRRVEAEGGFAAIVRKGDADRGVLLLLIAHRGNHFACLERALSVDGEYRWCEVGPDASAAGQVAEWIARRVKFDEDIWLIELDVAAPERFVAEMTSRA
ncbi:DUF1491 family protein [Sphingomonas xanthus]|uniref:DUF1491 family protein n=1 Tax=Sphingomonas xanthus TaxID=2594473 RepID=A0A516IRN8_9SPHN|nr:DUF1491 family protein [Sphingomonas xanthus]QDP19557.1 DUF1491 family protein [Sphingomonas xanthus]